MLTPKQHKLLMFIQKRIDETGISPSFDEMKEALNLASKSGIHRLITALEERGFLRRLPHRARALEVVKIPGAAAASPAAAAPRLTATPVVNAVSAPLPPPGAVVDVPLLGRIAAGTPIEAIQHELERVPAPPSILGRGEHFALEVRGDSMIDAAIMDGDIVFIRRTETADNGSIVVALVDNEEATLKRLRRRNGLVALEAENPAYETRELEPHRVKVQGQLAGLLRRYP